MSGRITVDEAIRQLILDIIQNELDLPGKDDVKDQVADDVQSYLDESLESDVDQAVENSRVIYEMKDELQRNVEKVEDSVQDIENMQEQDRESFQAYKDSRTLKYKINKVKQKIVSEVQALFKNMKGTVK